jgi:Dolichyl-phosphate-mannose-protein mannosyltransferase
LIVVVALGARLAFAWDQTHKIPTDVLASASFDQETGSIAKSVATGKGFSSPYGRDTGPTAWLAPVYPLLVAGTFRILGVATLSSFYFLVALNILFSAGTCVPIYLLAKRVAGVGVGSTAAWLWALYPNAIMIPFEWIWDTSLSALLAATILWATLELSESNRWRDWRGYALLWGFTLLTNPAIGSLLPFLLGWAGYRQWRRNPLHAQAWARRPAAALGLAILCCVPWTIRNYSVFHRFVPLRSNFAFELYIGNNENYDEKYRHMPGPITKDRETLRYLRMGEMPFLDEERRKATRFIETHPRMELVLFGDRFAAFWSGTPFAWETFLAADSWLLRGLILCAVLSGLGALGGTVVLLWKRSAYTFPLAVCPVVFPLVYYVTHTSLRYRHPIDPVVVLLTAVAGGAVWQFFARRWSSEASISATSPL